MTNDQRELLQVMDGDQWRAVEALLQQISTRFAEAVLKTSIQNGSREITLAKAKLEGAQGLIDGMVRAKRELTKEK